MSQVLHGSVKTAIQNWPASEEARHYRNHKFGFIFRALHYPLTTPAIPKDRDENDCREQLEPIGLG